MGNDDADTALKIPGVSLAAACYLNSGRLTRVKENSARTCTQVLITGTSSGEKILML